GILVSTVSQPDQATANRCDVRTCFFLVDVSTATLTYIARVIDEEGMSIKIGTILPLEGVMRAHEMLEGKYPNPGGKIVLDILNS
ncbi:MAG: hypothetical protein ABJA60_06650, partial [Nitrosospira sp.]